MNVHLLQAFVSLLLVLGWIATFIWSERARESKHAAQLALARLDDDGFVPRPPLTAPPALRPWTAPLYPEK